jgi:protein-disulfide isomerase
MLRSRRRLAVAGACALAVVLVGALIGIQQLTAGGDTVAAPDPSALVNVDVAKATLAGIPETRGVLGSPTAPATIRVYADLRCPVCKEWDAAEAPDVIAGDVKTGKAKLDLRLWAILGPNSEAAHRAGYAAMQQNRLWLYATIVYYNQGDEARDWFTDDFARAVAVAAGLDLKRFDADRASGAADQMIGVVGAEAQSLGLTGTPTIGVAKGNAQPTFFNAVPTAADIANAVKSATA